MPATETKLCGWVIHIVLSSESSITPSSLDASENKQFSGERRIKKIGLSVESALQNIVHY